MTFSASWAARARKPPSVPKSKSEDNSDSDESKSEAGDEARAHISPVPPGLLASVVVFGADGDLASKKILPTLFNLWRRKLVPRDLLVFGCAAPHTSRSSLPTSIAPAAAAAALSPPRTLTAATLTAAALSAAAAAAGTCHRR